VAGSDESTKWAYSLGCEVAVVWFDFQELSQRSCQEGTQAANAGNKRMREVSHLNFRIL
jgi:hypothetical protein